MDFIYLFTHGLLLIDFVFNLVLNLLHFMVVLVVFFLFFLIYFTVHFRSFPEKYILGNIFFFRYFNFLHFFSYYLFFTYLDAQKVTLKFICEAFDLYRGYLGPTFIYLCLFYTLNLKASNLRKPYFLFLNCFFILILYFF